MADYDLITKYPNPVGNRPNVHHQLNSTNSTRVGGKLVLRSNPFDMTHCVEKKFSDSYVGVCSGFADKTTIPVYGGPGYDSQLASLTNAALARFTGKVRKHNASLGVSLGSWAQSRDMLTDRTQKLASFFDRAVVRAEKLPSKVRRRKAIEGRAGDFLEWEFGWVPLVKDVQACFDTLGRSPPPQWVRSTVRGRYYNQEVQDGNPTWRHMRTRNGNLMVTVGSKVIVTSENLWLLNRLGLLNLAGVAWDLTPWSFVVNMFTNMGQMVNSVTDFCGLALSNGSTTKTSVIERTSRYDAKPGFGPSWSESVVEEKRKVRTVGLPNPSFQFRAPQLNLELAAIACSLILQRISALNRIFGVKP